MMMIMKVLQQIDDGEGKAEEGGLLYALYVKVANHNCPH